MLSVLHAMRFESRIMKVVYIRPCKRGIWGHLRGNIAFNRNATSQQKSQQKRYKKKKNKKKVIRAIAPRKSDPRLGLGFRLGLISFKVGGQFSSWAMQ